MTYKVTSGTLNLCYSRLWRSGYICDKIKPPMGTDAQLATDKYHQGGGT